jgi:hypothetical protein
VLLLCSGKDLMVLYFRLLCAVLRLGDLSFAACFVFCCLPFVAAFFVARFAFTDRVDFAATLATSTGFSKESSASSASLEGMATATSSLNRGRLSSGNFALLALVHFT